MLKISEREPDNVIGEIECDDLSPPRAVGNCRFDLVYHVQVIADFITAIRPCNRQIPVIRITEAIAVLAPTSLDEQYLQYLFQTESYGTPTFDINADIDFANLAMKHAARRITETCLEKTGAVKLDGHQVQDSLELINCIFSTFHNIT